MSCLCIDVNAYAGHWPSHPVNGDLIEVVASLKEVGVDRICISPLDAVWCRNPQHYNRWLLEVTRSLPEVIPVPVLDPTMETWREELDVVTNDPRVRMIKLHPAYHGYELSAVDACLETVGEKKLAVQIQTRMEDPRRQHPLQQVPDVLLKDIVEAAERHPDVRVLGGGPRWPEVQQEQERLRSLPNVFVDVSQCDGLDTIRRFCEWELGNKLLFASHAPLFIPWSAVARVVTDIDDMAAGKILGGNAAAVLGIETKA